MSNNQVNPKPIELFNRWFVNPINELKKLPNGDGGFAAFMIALPLYERYIVANLKINGNPTDEDTVRNEISKDLDLTSKERSIFWDIFRNGFMHEAMPKTGKTDWLTSSEYNEFPKFKTVNDNTYICIDPWKFADRVLNKFISDHRLITASDSFPLASIAVIEK